MRGRVVGPCCSGASYRYLVFLSHSKKTIMYSNLACAEGTEVCSNKCSKAGGQLVARVIHFLCVKCWLNPCST